MILFASRKSLTLGAKFSLACDSFSTKTHSSCAQLQQRAVMQPACAALLSCYSIYHRRTAPPRSSSAGTLVPREPSGELFRRFTIGNRHYGQGTMGERRRKRETDGQDKYDLRLSASVEPRPQNVQVVFSVETVTVSDDQSHESVA